MAVREGWGDLPPSTPPFAMLRQKVEGFGRAAVALLERYSLGLDPRWVRHEADRLGLVLERAARRSAQPDLGAQLLARLGRTAWSTEGRGENLHQSEAHAAGALLTSSMWISRTDPDELVRAFIAKTLYEHFTEMLDDIIDTGAYTRSESACLFRAALIPLTQARIDAARFRSRIRGLVCRAGAALVDPLVDVGMQLHDELRRAPRLNEWSAIFEAENRVLAQGQSLTVLLRRERLDVSTVQRVARRFYAPSRTVGWVERLGKYTSQASNLALLDMSFARPDAPLGDINEYLRAWYYLDAVIAILDHVADLESDARAGIVNFALLKMRPDGPASGRTAADLCRTLTNEDFDRLLQRLAQMSAVAVVHAERSGMVAPRYFRLLAVLVPVVMFSSGKDPQMSRLPAYLDRLTAQLNVKCPVVRSATPQARATPGTLAYQATRYSQQSAPVRTHEVFTTEPWTPRAAMIPS